MNNLKIRNNQDDYVASSTKNVLFYSTVGKEQKVYRTFFVATFEMELTTEQEKKLAFIQNM